MPSSLPVPAARCHALDVVFVCRLLAAEEFQSWKLKVNPDHTATLTCEDGNGGAVFTKAIEYTDFPLEEITLFFMNKTILLPSEY
jgi:hypothetical protein